MDPTGATLGRSELWAGLITLALCACATEDAMTAAEDEGHRGGTPGKEPADMSGSQGPTNETEPAGSSDPGATDPPSMAGSAGVDAPNPPEMPPDEPGTMPGMQDDPDGVTPDTLDFACPGGTIGEGISSLNLGGRTRTLFAQFPANRSVPMGIAFSWHGFNEDPVAYRNHVGLDPNFDRARPLVIVTPDDADFEIPAGLDWQLNSGEPTENIDLAFFEAMVGCLDDQYEIDPTRIYSVGFSAGSVMSSLLHSRYPKLISAIVCYSGMWFNDPAQVAMIKLVPVMGTWPLLDPADSGTVLLTHGGPRDVTVLNVANLEDMAQAAFPFLEANNRAVVDCAHDLGHTPPPELTRSMASQFLLAHRAGDPSPYLGSGYQGFPASCNLRLP